MPGRRAVLLGAAVALSASACTGSVTSECDVAVVTQPPATPQVLEPGHRDADVVSASLVISTSPFSDPDAADTHAESQFEIWAFKSGIPIARVWRAHVDDPAKLRAATIADGSFDAGESVTQLSDGQAYAARARHRDSSAGCDGWSEWSEYRKFRTDDGSSHLFDQTAIRDVHFDIPPESWDAIDAEAVPPDCIPYQRNYYAATVRFEDQVFAGAGLRAKGGCGSARRLNGKPGFKANLSWDDPNVPECPDERRLYGLERLTLNNMNQDRSFLHERVGYELYRAMGVPTPRAMHTRLFVNDELWGLYLHVESIDRRFLSRWFDSNDGMLYEGTYWCDLLPENVPPDDQDTHCLTRKFHDGPCKTQPAGADPLDYSLLRDMVNRVAAIPDGQFYAQIHDIFEFDTLLTSWAVDATIAHWDGYEYDIMNNYRVYHDPATDRWSLIPTGIDQTFRDDLDPFDVSGILARRCLDEPACVTAFGAKLHQVVTVFESMALDQRVLEIRDQIDPYVQDDPRREGGHDEFLALAQNMRQWITERPDVVRGILASRGL
jgi:hypothetical protein